MCCAVKGSVQGMWNLKCKVYVVEALWFEEKKTSFSSLFSIAVGTELQNVAHLSGLRQ